jgi:hypothetical protein
MSLGRSSRWKRILATPESQMGIFDLYLVRWYVVLTLDV